MNETMISRRQLVSGAAVAGVACGGMFTVKALAEEASAQAAVAGTPSFFATPDPIDDSQVVETYDYDIVVVGAGVSGIAATVSALKNGAKVACVEKFGAPNSQGSEASAIDLDESDPAGVQWLVSKHIAANGYRSVREVVETWAQRSGEVLHYLMDFFAGQGDAELVLENEPHNVVEGEDYTCTQFWMVPGKGNYAMWTGAAAPYVQSQGADFYFNCPAVQLVVEDGKVTGVICQNEDEEYVRFNAAKGVILCTGDYQNDNDMVRYFLPDLTNTTPKQIGKTGDGFKMAVWAGGVVEPVGHTKMSHGYAAGPMGDLPLLRVNDAGERFCNEDVDLYYMQTFFRMSDVTGSYYNVFGGDFADQVTGWGGDPADPAKMGAYVVDDPEYNGRSETYRADTIEELAGKIGMDPAVLGATIDRYNELCAKGSDDDFGKSAKYMCPVDTAPFYAVHRLPVITAITSGVLTDGKQRIVDGNGDPIPGLFAAGNTAGGFFGAIDYPLRNIEGLSIGRGMTGGYVAAEVAMSE